jgi:hypothetical protein
MQYEETAISSNRIKKAAQVKRIEKKLKSTDINQMSSFAIVWHLVKRHKISLLVTACIVQFLALIGVLPLIADLLSSAIAGLR